MPTDPVSRDPHVRDPLAGLNPAKLLQQGLPHQTGSTQARGDSWQPLPVPEVQALLPAFEIHELIGRGGMGAVYKARQVALDRLVAIKILPPQVGRDPAFAERFAREAKALARLNHPRIVAVHDAGSVPLPGSSDKLYYFVMEFVDGATLREVMHAGSLPPADAMAVVPQICEALQYAHDEGVVHRDIKPDNILLDTRGRVKIADFGLAKLLGLRPNEVTLTGTHQVMGTFHYMAPEQMSGNREIDHRADIYSLGVVFYELLTGEVPHGPFEPPSHRVQVDVRLDEVVLRTLAREPAKRYQQAGQVKTDIDTISRHASAHVQPFQPEPKPGAAPAATPFTSLNPFDPRREKQRSTPKQIVILLFALLGLPIGLCGMGCLGSVFFHFLSRTADVVVRAPLPTQVTPLPGHEIHSHDEHPDAMTYPSFGTPPIISPQEVEPQSGGSVRDVVATKDGKYVISAGEDGMVKIQDQLSGVKRAVQLVATGNNRYLGLNCLALSHDEKHVFAAGKSSDDRYGRIYKVRLEDCSHETMVVEMTTSPVNIRHVKPWLDGPPVMSCVVGDTDFIVCDMEGNLLKQKPIFPGNAYGRIQAIASSPAGEFTALTASSMLPGSEGAPSADSTHLTLFDLRGKELLKWPFANTADFTHAQVAFPNDSTLLVAVPSGQLHRWERKGATDEWEPKPTKRIAPGSYLAAAVSDDREAIWLAVERQLWCFDLKTGERRASADLTVGARRGGLAQLPVEAIAPIAGGKKIAAALWDGRVQIVEVIPDAPPKSNPTSTGAPSPPLPGQEGSSHDRNIKPATADGH